MGSRWARYVAVVGLSVLVGFTIYTELTQRGSAVGLRSGEQLPPFAAPLAIGGPSGDVNVAVHGDEGQAGRRPACAVRGAGILNLCALYERRPVVLALFIDGGSCPQVLAPVQAVASSFPSVAFAAVAVKGQRSAITRLVRSRRLTIPVAVDRDGVLAGLYRMASCPLLTFAYPGGRAQGRPIFDTPSAARLSARVAALLSAARARGWRAPSSPRVASGRLSSTRGA